MNLLAALNHRYPNFTGLLGTTGSLTGWIFAHIHEINTIGVLIGTYLGILIGVLTIALKVDDWIHRRRNRRAFRRDKFVPDRWHEDDHLKY